MEFQNSHINCPNCQNSIPILNIESEFFVCSKCHKLVDKSRKIYVKKLDAEQSGNIFTLPLGSMFEFKGLTYTITGAMTKCEASNSEAVWIEYFLTHPSSDNIYISEWNGHWNVIEHFEDFKENWSYSHYRSSVIYNEVQHHFYHSYTILIKFAIGEFNFNAFDDEKNIAFEYINPPYLFIVERTKSNQELNYFKSTYLYPNEIKSRLDRKVKLPKKIGIAGSQPFYWNIHPRNFIVLSIIISLFLLLTQLCLSYQFPDFEITKTQFTAVTSDSTITYSSTEFEIPYDKSILEVKLNCNDIDNDWVSADFALVNNLTDEERYFTMDAEYYHGYEDGESWTEGNKEVTGYIEKVPKGLYHLEITPLQQSGSLPKFIRVYLTNFKFSKSILFSIIGFIVLINIIIGIMHDYFNHKKWDKEYDTFDWILNSEE